MILTIVDNWVVNISFYAYVDIKRDYKEAPVEDMKQ